MSGRAFVPVLLLALCCIGPAQEIKVPQPTKNPADLASLSADDLVIRGDEARGQKDLYHAIDCYRAALVKQYSAPTFNKLGMTYLGLQKHELARQSFEKASKLDRNFADAYNNAGVIYYLTKKYGRSVKLYKKAIQLKPESASYHSNLGAAYFSKKDVKKAIEEYQTALQLDPEVFERSSTTGVSAHMGSPEERAHFSYEIAKVYAKRGDFDRAIRYLRKAMEDGYNVEGVYKEDDFATLRKDQRFADLMAQKPQSIPQ